MNIARFAKQYAAGVRLDVELPLPTAGVTVLFGPSGCGKTTTLRCLAGLDTPDAGAIHYAGATWFDARTRLTPQARRVGFLFQDYALFPHLSVSRNVAFGARGTVAELLAKFDLEALRDRMPHALSGGQRQRVALARVLAVRPQLLLLDEPLSALDEPLRVQLRHQLRGWLAPTPAIVVTHDRTEAVALGDMLAVMDEGKIVQFGPLADVFDRPATDRVAAMLGVETIRAGVVVGHRDGLTLVRVGPVELASATIAAGEVLVCIRGEDVTLAPRDAAGTSARNRFPARVERLLAEGALVRVVLDAGFPLTAVVTRQAVRELGLVEGSTVAAAVKAPAVHLIPRA